MKTYPNAKALLSAWSTRAAPEGKAKSAALPSRSSPLQLRNANRPAPAPK